MDYVFPSLRRFGCNLKVLFYRNECVSPSTIEPIEETVTTKVAATQTKSVYVD